MEEHDEHDIINGREKVDFDRESETSVSVQWLERRRRSLRRRPLLMVFSNCNKTSPCSAFSSLPRQKEKESRISLRFTTTTTTRRWASFREMQSYRFFPVTLRDAFPLCLPEWKLDPLLVPPRSLLPTYAREAHRGIERVEEDFYLRRRKQIPLEIFISVGIMLRSRQTTLPELFRIALCFDSRINVVE